VTVTICKRLEWDSAHRVMRHESKCATLHGHRYAAEIFVEAAELDEVDRVIDFGVVKQLVGGWIEEHWDHTTLVNIRDQGLLNFCRYEQENAGKRAPYAFPGEPTAENIAAELAKVARPLLEDSRVRLRAVRVWETPTSWAAVEVA
jgi:6-pyruvoyltetrahydropterin/6-carboxytetrahydropterin synthase